DAMRKTPGVADAVLAYRTALKGPRGDIGVLAVSKLDRVPSRLWWRADFAAHPPDRLLERIQPSNPASYGIPVPAGAGALALFAYVDSQAPLFGFGARIRDARGAYFELPYFEVPNKSWQALS